MSLKFKHFLLCRYNVGVYYRKWTNIQINEWMKKRLDLFFNFNYPSIKNQLCHNFCWILFFDDKTPIDYLDIFKKLNINVCSVDGQKTILPNIHDAGPYLLQNDAKLTIQNNLNDEDIVISSRCDSDDCLSNCFFLNIQKMMRSKIIANILNNNKIIFSFPNQLILDKSSIYKRYYPKNQFISLAEKADNIKTVWEYNHNKICDKYNIFCFDEIGSLWNIHDSNLSPKIKYSAQKINDFPIKDVFGIK